MSVDGRIHANTPDRIVAAAEALLISSDELDSISLRRIAALAEVPPSAISYHFGSRDNLLTEAGRSIYRRFNSERLHLLQAALDERAPEPADLDRIIDALIGPSVRWSLDPRSSYRAFVNLTALTRRSGEVGVSKSLRSRDQHLKPFFQAFHSAAPWLGEAEIGFRIHCALGIRSNVVRERGRLQALTGNAYDLGDADAVIKLMINVIAPMFTNTPR